MLTNPSYFWWINLALAKLDGAGSPQIMLRILLPLVKATVAVVAMFTMQTLVGLKPGCQEILIQSRPIKGITGGSASLVTPYGKHKCAWHCENKQVTANMPPGADSVFDGLIAELNQREKANGLACSFLDNRQDIFHGRAE